MAVSDILGSGGDSPDDIMVAAVETTLNISTMVIMRVADSLLRRQQLKTKLAHRLKTAMQIKEL